MEDSRPIDHLLQNSSLLHRHPLHHGNSEGREKGEKKHTNYRLITSDRYSHISDGKFQSTEASN